MHPHTQSMANPLPGALQTAHESLNAAQAQTVAFFKANARETGATITVDCDPGCAPIIIEVASAEWDREVTVWTLRPDGTADLH